MNTIFISKEFLTLCMDAKIIKVTDKGQISLPKSFRDVVGIEKGCELVAIRRNNAIILQPLNDSHFKDLLLNSEKTAKKLWSRKEDDIWDSV
ncbi:MAG: AbrB/MazE/SpoVT family DNA-binding domain-containing protein [Candidatus Woesearchaeota archaeon]